MKYCVYGSNFISLEGGDMNFFQLEYFVTAIESGSYASASRKLFVNPSTISLAITHLENELDMQLLCRSNNGVEPTVEGRDFYDLACQTLLSFVQLKEFSAKPAQPQSSKILHVATGSSRLVGSLVPKEIFSSFCSSFPKMNLKLYEIASQICISHLKLKIADAAIVTGKPDDPDLESTRICNKQVRILIGKNNPANKSGKIDIRSILHMPIALPYDVDLLFEQICSLFSKYSSEPEFEYLEPSVDAITHFAERTQGITFVFDDNALESRYPNLDLKDLTAEERFLVPIYFIKRRFEESEYVDALLSYMRSYGTRVKRSASTAKKNAYQPEKNLT